MKLPRIVYATPPTNRALVRQAILHGLMFLVLCGLIWLSFETGRFPSRLHSGGGIGAEMPFAFYLAALAYGLMCLLSGWVASQAVVTLVVRLLRGPRQRVEGDQ